ncbi:hypothetical protein G7Y89_g14644 [Cudoniella acicularis]|uniref:t-SNARE coiled-coil homology domain-containing protein n=1 Tax=Cudoniella acicularis TaxID=354080 RepID=A0A8H4QZT5_9HELO|nr:hypothetical protein G7Y89_g14644 [Cudoniella acicularis]
MVRFSMNFEYRSNWQGGLKGREIIWRVLTIAIFVLLFKRSSATKIFKLPHYGNKSQESRLFTYKERESFLKLRDLLFSHSPRFTKQDNRGVVDLGRKESYHDIDVKRAQAQAASAMWRDRTNLYISYRQSYAHHPAKKPRYSSSASGNGYSDSIIGGGSSERQGLMSAGAFEDDGDAVIEMDLLPPRWADISDEVTECLADIASKSVKLEKLHQKHVLPGFDDEEVKKSEEGEIERLTQDITKGFHDCQKAIQRVEMMVRETKQQGGINPSLMESDADKSYSQTALQQTSQKQLTSNDAAIMQREREIMDIAQGIIELADIFKELQGMIIDQGTMLDRIDYNVERMAVDVKAADKELKVASGYQKKGTKRRIILLLILLVNHSLSSRNSRTPVEIRCGIWKLAVPERRTIHLFNQNRIIKLRKPLDKSEEKIHSALSISLSPEDILRLTGYNQVSVIFWVKHIKMCFLSLEFPDLVITPIILKSDLSPTTFRSSKKLPIELHLHIWSLVPDPRVVEIDHCVTWFCIGESYRPCALPFASKEARQQYVREWLPFVPIHPSSFDYQPFSNPIPRSPISYLNPNIDIIYLPSPMAGGDHYDEKVIKQLADLDVGQKLQFLADEFREWRFRQMEPIEDNHVDEVVEPELAVQFPKLEEFMLVADNMSHGHII